jgi:hypothetical protein
MKRVLGNVDDGLAGQIRAVAGVLSYWRNDTAHGVRTTVGEGQAYATLAHVLRLAQMANDHWETLTA